MSRVYLLQDARGQRRLEAADLPLGIGGATADLALPGQPPDALLAHIGIAEGHAFIQPVADAPPLFHNHQRLTQSAWLKSGDRVEVGDALLTWTVQGDQVRVQTQERQDGPILTPPPAPSTATASPEPPLPAPAAPSRRRGLRLLLASLFALLLLAAGFVLLALRVDLRIEPTPDHLSLSGLPPALPVWGQWLAWPGDYRLRAEHPGYFPLEQSLELRRGGPAEYRFALRERPGVVRIALEPAVPFRLLLDDQVLEPGPEGGFEIPRGSHRLRVESERYLPVEQELEVEGLGRTQELAFRLQPAWARLRLDSQPSGAAVYLGERLLGRTPLDTELLQGPARLRLTLARHQSLELDLEVQAGQPLDLGRVALQPAPGRLQLETRPSGASLSLDGRFIGTTPLQLELSSTREHQLRLSKPGHRTLTHALRLEPEQALALSLKLEPEYGVVFIASQPADAELLVDGRPAGPASQRLRLPSRTHRLEVRKSGFESKQLSVLPDPGYSQTLEVELRTLAAARRTATPGRITSPGGQALVLVRPRGSFQLGASRREPGRRANEHQRLVALSRPFYLGEKEVSNAEFRRFRSGHRSGRAEGAALDGERQPVVNVSWEEAARYCNWLSQQAGLDPFYQEIEGKLRPAEPPNQGYRLPTEAEWAYAAQVLGRTQPARYPWGQGYPPQAVQGNYADQRIADTLADSLPNYDDGFRGSAPVGSFAAGPGGFYDLGGNVAEWTNDLYAVYPGQAERLVRDPLGPADGEHHLVKGAGWRQGSLSELRLSYRDYSREARPDLGFRIARYAAPEASGAP